MQLSIQKIETFVHLTTPSRKQKMHPVHGKEIFAHNFSDEDVVLEYMKDLLCIGHKERNNPIK